MFEKWTQHLSHNDVSFVAYELARRIRRKKPIYPLSPVPQTKRLILSEELTQIADEIEVEIENDDLCESLIVDDIEAEIEAQYQIPIDEVDLGPNLKSSTNLTIFL